MEQLSETKPTRTIRPQTSGPPIPPAQLWGLLSPQQKHAVFQRLVGLCQELLHRQPPDEPEVPNEPL